MRNFPSSEWRRLLEQGLDDDGAQWDWTALGTLGAKADKEIRAKIIAKSEGVWAAGPLIDATNEVAGFEVVRARISDGDALNPGDVVCEWKGPARLILALERPFLNLASYAGGIATRTRGLAALARKACPKKTPRVTPTRKILPGYRDIAIHAVMAGGGHSHRVSLSGGVLIKENHIAAAGSIRAAVDGARKLAPHGLKIEIEVRDEKELKKAISAGAEVIMLDNFTPAEARRALKPFASRKARPVFEVSGGIHEGNIAEYSFAGVDVISVGSLTHSVTSIDLSLLVSSSGAE